MSEEYQGPDPAIADYVAECNAEADRESERLKNATPDEAALIAADPAESVSARVNAFLVLSRQRDPRLDDLILALCDDPTQELWKSVVSSFVRKDSRIKAALTRLLDSAEPEIAGTAAFTLARMQDESLLPRMIAWLDQPDSGLRNVALAVLKQLRNAEALLELNRRWDTGWGSSEDRLALASELVEFHHQPALTLLGECAQQARGPWSVMAATCIYFADQPQGLSLMRHILDVGDLESRQAMVLQIDGIGTTLPHAYNADGLHEARLWVETQLQRPTPRGEAC